MVILDIPQQRVPASRLFAMLVGGADERSEQRMRLQRLRFELRMELAAQEPGMIRDLADLDVTSDPESRR